MAFGLGLSMSSHVLPDMDVNTPVTNGMALSATWRIADGAQTTLVNSTETSIKIIASVEPSDSGILLEQGGGGSGTVIYVYGGVLYAQFGDGSGIGSGSARAFIQYTITKRIDLIEASASISNGRCALYVDRVLVGTDTLTNNALAGGDVGGVGRVYNGAAANYGDWSSDGSGVFTGHIDRAEIFLNQITADVAQ